MTQDQNGLSPAILALAQWVNEKPVSDEALRLMLQFGFIHPDLNGKLRLTTPGREVLIDSGLARK